MELAATNSKRKVVDTRRLLGIVFGFKVGLLVVCFSLLCAQFLIGKLWFNLSARKSAVKAAIQPGLNVDVRNELGLTGLMLAGNIGDVGLARALIAGGAALNLKADKIYGDTALHYAGWVADVPTNREIFDLLLKNGANARVPNNNGDTPLHYLLFVQDLSTRLQMFRVLIAHGADINAQNKFGNTIMHRAVNMRNKYWITMLLDNFASLLDLSLRNTDGRTPLDYTEYLGFKNVAKVLRVRLKRLDTVGVRDPNGWTALMLAVMRNDTAAVRRLIKAKAAINIRAADASRHTALHLAVLHEKVPMVKQLLKAGASRMALDNNRNIPLHLAMRPVNSDTQIKMAKALLAGKGKGTINTRNINGNTLLHLAVMNNKQGLVGFLVNTYGSVLDTTIKNKQLRTPRDLARLLNRQEIGRTLDRLKK